MKINLFIESCDEGEYFGSRCFVEKEFEFTKDDLESIIEHYDNPKDWKINGKYDLSDLGSGKFDKGIISIINKEKKRVLKFNYSIDWRNVRGSFSASHMIEEKNRSRIKSALQDLNPNFQEETGSLTYKKG